ncbi:iron-containing alcohol dehydrogenase [Massilia cavernae]|uniref:Iron-containing alcohol dehydrogenase n=1 Tax=Massilia cavernae TaxID=2320864 RepID=A0A418XQW9_9BURK|nr:iron-containing alcohol dehydrogenase [Massilia cavernae]
MTPIRVSWNYPTAIKAGAGSIELLPGLCQSLGMTNPLLVTDPGLARLALPAAAVELCRAAGLRCAVFSEVKGNPNGENVTAGVAAYHAGLHDGVIAFGGGSAIDAAKAIALMVGQDRPLWDFEDIGDNCLRVKVDRMAPVIAVPTTAGTGSEVGRASVITDEQARVKRIIFHARMLPAAVILDPELSVGLPPSLTAATGMDALSHNLEAYCSPFYHPMAAGVALEGIRLVKDWLPAAVAVGGNLEARLHMLVASSMGATAFQRGLGAMHALAHPLGALYDAHHGMLNAILMPYVLKANRAAIDTRVAALARYLDLPDPSFDAFLDWVLALRAQLGIPHALSALGIDATEAAQVARMAVADGSAATNPIAFSEHEYARIFTDAVAGEL